MKIVIDIPDEDYTAICANGYIFDEDNEDIAKAIKNGKIIENGRPTFIYKGKALYLTEEHIDALVKYEEEQTRKEVFDNVIKNITMTLDNGFADDGLTYVGDWQVDKKAHFPKTLDSLVYRNDFCPHAHNCIEYFGSHCADRCPLKKESTNEE